MDSELQREMEHILSLEEDTEMQSKSLTKVLVYLLSMNSLGDSNYSLLKRFIAKAYEILPSSSLPQQLARKLDLPIERKRSVSFSTSSFHRLESDKLLSAEGEEQKSREANSIMSITNVDVNRKFTPRMALVPGFKNNVKETSIMQGLLINSYTPSAGNLKKDFKRILIPKISIQQILANPGIVRKLI